MGWKTSETPLNLIHILPPGKSKKSKAKFSNDESQRLRIQVGDEAPSAGIEYFSRIFRLISGGCKQLREMIHGWFKLCGRGCSECVGYCTSFMAGLLDAMKKTLAWMADVFFLAGSTVQEQSCKLWGILTTSTKRVNLPQVNIHPSSVKQHATEHSNKLKRDELLCEVHALRDQLTAQRSELTRVNTQIGELKALALSQQQVLLHLGQELESIESKTVRQEKGSPKKVRTRSPKTSKSKPLPSSQASTEQQPTAKPPTVKPPTTTQPPAQPSTEASILLDLLEPRR